MGSHLLEITLTTAHAIVIVILPHGHILCLIPTQTYLPDLDPSDFSEIEINKACDFENWRRLQEPRVAKAEVQDLPNINQILFLTARIFILGLG